MYKMPLIYVFGVGASIFCIGVLGNDILLLVFCPKICFMALDESVRRNPTQPVYLLQIEGHLLWSAAGLEPTSIHIYQVGHRDPVIQNTMSIK